MKKLFISLVFTTIATLISAQSEWAPTGAKWYYFYFDSFISQYFAYTDYIAGDTIIKGKSCKILKQDPLWINSRTCDFSTSNSGVFVYGEGNKAWFYSPARDSFRLLYDFDTPAGSMWSLDTCDGNSDLGILPYKLDVFVDSTAIENIDGREILVQYVRYLKNGFPTGASDKIFEGIGAFRGLWVFGPFIGLKCYESPSTGTIHFMNVPCDAVNSVKPEEIATKLSVRLFPNPAKETLNIGFLIPLVQPVEWSLYDGLGRLLHRERLAEGQAEYTLSLPEAPAGLYFWNLSAAGTRVQGGKLIISK
jgi:hypothetical protein